MRILLVFYSGTGNTAYLTERLKEAFSASGDKVTVLSLPFGGESGLDDYDLIGFGYPIYAFNEPGLFMRAIKGLRLREGQNCFIYKNSGEVLHLNDCSSRHLIRLLRRRKCPLVGEYHFVMPYNIHFRYEDDFVKQIMLENDKLAAILIHDLHHGIIKKIIPGPVSTFVGKVLKVQRIGGPINSFFYHVDGSKCTHCLLCVRSCPVKNVYEAEGKIRFRHHCEMCMRCSFMCPTDAINIGFLNAWRVNGPYRFEKIKNNPGLSGRYITDASSGFFKCYIDYYKKLDREYEALGLGGKIDG